MSGHSKWSTIKHQKGAADAKRGVLFTKLSREMTLAVRDGGGGDQPDPLTGEGRLARTLFRTSGEDVAASRMAFPDDPELRVLYEERTALEARVEALRVLRTGASDGQYAEELQAVLVELALKGRAIRQLEEIRGAR